MYDFLIYVGHFAYVIDVMETQVIPNFWDEISNRKKAI